MQINTKLKRLFRTVAERGGTLISPKALASAMEVTQSAITQWFGWPQENLPLSVPAARLGRFIAEFRKAGIPIEMHWLTAPLDEFDRLLREKTGFDARPALSWTDAVRRFSRAHDGLALCRPKPPPAQAGFRLREEGTPVALPLDRFHIDERVYLALDVPEDFPPDSGAVFATVVHETWHETNCLFPVEGATIGLMVSDTLRLPAARDRHYQVSGPVGVQRVHAILSRFRPAGSVHAGLADVDLHLGLDRLASELAERPEDSWRLLTMAYQVVEPATARDGLASVGTAHA
jgi:hypothetical protein